MITLINNYVTLECRSTGRGAFTTLECFGQVPERFAESRTGNHWRERLKVEDGQEIYVVDISNSGKHNCCCYRVAGDQLDLVAEADPMGPECPVCDA